MMRLAVLVRILIVLGMGLGTGLLAAGMAYLLQVRQIVTDAHGYSRRMGVEDEPLWLIGSGAGVVASALTGLVMVVIRPRQPTRNGQADPSRTAE